jgi:rsbT co-antagonist protein RsbR
MRLLIGQKLSLIVMLLFGLHLGAFAVTQYHLAVYRSNAVRLANESLPQVQTLTQLEVSSATIVQQVSLYLASGDPNTTTTLELDIITARQQVQQLRATADRFTRAVNGQASPMDQVERDVEALVQESRLLTDARAAKSQQEIKRDTQALNARARALKQSLQPLQQVIRDDQLTAVSAVRTNPLALPAGLTVLIAGVVLALLWGVRSSIVRPIQELTAATTSVAAGNSVAELQSRSTDEIGLLAQSFNHMARTIQHRTQDLETQYAAASAARSIAEAAHAQITEQLATIESQATALREMSVPILPISTNAILMPLVGALDRARLALVQDRALEAIQRNNIRWLLLDVTGVPMIDEPVAQGIMQVVRAARLLGSQVVLVGIRPEVAQAMVSLGVDLSQIVTQRSLESATAFAQGSLAAQAVR